MFKGGWRFFERKNNLPESFGAPGGALKKASDRAALTCEPER